MPFQDMTFFSKSCCSRFVLSKRIESTTRPSHRPHTATRNQEDVQHTRKRKLPHTFATRAADGILLPQQSRLINQPSPKPETPGNQNHHGVRGFMTGLGLPFGSKATKAQKLVTTGMRWRQPQRVQTLNHVSRL
jgi:hypothetical protein